MKLKRIAALLLVLCAILPQLALGAGFTDVPENSWALADIAAANETGIMDGRGGNIFGYGDSITRGEFAAMLVRLMGWEKSIMDTSPYKDAEAKEWYFGYVNTLWEKGIEKNESYRPKENITRREMAVMLVKALGYDKLAQGEINKAFSDVTKDGGYISVAYELGIINGNGGRFNPEGDATREQGAAMMMRVYRKLYSKIDELHGFYAISSRSQRDMAKSMDTVSFGWARLEYDGGVFLNQTSKNSNDWKKPDGYESALKLMRESGVNIHLAVTMTDSEDSKAVLTNPANISEAVKQIVSAADGFDGVTIDFEGMKGAERKNGLNSFVKELKSALGGKKLYITVHPVLKNSGEYYDAYDYRTLGEVCDRVILMAHDYAANTLPDSLLNTGFIATPVSPFDEVYTALRAITDENTGVADINKVELALSTANTAAWNVKDRKITESQAIHPSLDTLQKRLKQESTEIIYSDTYRNPYAWYTTESGQDILVWYEDSRSISDKIGLAKMFGVNNISVWRLGAIPDGAGDTYMNVWETLIGR